MHKQIIEKIPPMLTAVSSSVFMQSVMLFFITVAAAAAYDRLLREKCTAAMESVLRRR